MTTDYYTETRELGSSDPESPEVEPIGWSGLPEGEKIHLFPLPTQPYAAHKNGNDMVVRGKGGNVLDHNHEVEMSKDPIAGEVRRIVMRCP